MTILETPAAQAIALRRAYREWAMRFWSDLATLSQIAAEDFPDPDNAEAEVTRYDVDAMRDLSLQIGTLIVGYGANT